MEHISCYICGNSSNNSILVKSIEQNVTYKIVRCECGFKYLNPRPDEEEINSFYSADDYHPHSRGSGYIYKLYKLSQRLTFPWKYRIMKKYFKNNISHLDYGSGDGSFSKFLNRYGVHSISYDPFFKNNNKFSNSKVSKYSIITLFHSLEHIHDLNKLFLSLSEMLELNGVVIISVPNFNAPEREYLENNWAAYDFPRHLYHFDSKSLELLLQKKGFSVIDKRRMLLDTIYISLLSKSNNISYTKLFFIIFKSIYRVIIKGADFSSSLLYVCKKNK